MRVGGQRQAQAALLPGRRPDTRYTGGGVWERGGRADLDGCGKSRPHQNSILRLSSPKQVAVESNI